MVARLVEQAEAARKRGKRIAEERSIAQRKFRLSVGRLYGVSIVI